MTLANAAALLFTQSDKLLLSKLLPLEQFGYYTLAWTLAGIYYLFYSPVSAAFLPRFCTMLAMKDTVQAARDYHRSCQIVAVGAFPTAAVLTLFPQEIVNSWTHNPSLVHGTAPLLQLLGPFALIGCIGYMPSVLQWASGWTSITTRTYFVALVVMLPAMYLGFVSGGAAGAILAWGIVRTGQTLAQINLMHARLLVGEKWAWCAGSILRPAAGASAMAACWRLAPMHPVRQEIVLLAAVWLTCVAAAFVCSPLFHLSLRRFPALTSADL
jgi:O-antigen/teichoic acid export membrane protein